MTGVYLEQRMSADFSSFVRFNCPLVGLPNGGTVTHSFDPSPFHALEGAHALKQPFRVQVHISTLPPWRLES